MSRITANTYGQALATLVERHNTRPEYLQERNRELEDENARLRAEVKKLRAKLAAAEEVGEFRETPETSAAIPLTKWYKQNSMSYMQAYRLVTSGKIPAHQIGRQWFIDGTG